MSGNKPAKESQFRRIRPSFALLPEALLLDPNLSPGAKMLFAYLDLYSQTNPGEWPSGAQVSIDLGLNRETCRNFRLELEQSGWLKSESHLVENQIIADTAFILLERLGEAEIPPPRQPTNPSLPETNPNAELIRQAEEIYAIYPRRVGRKVAVRKIALAIRDHGFETILSATQGYAKARQGQDPAWTPHPSTWFGQGRFLDDPATWQPIKPQNGHANPTEIRGIQIELADIRARLPNMQEDDRIAYCRRQEELEGRLRSMMLTGT